jgi:NAD(P)-dependent dehydrogenase (short-subunit alcohol dehydrogenase family)
MKILIIGGNGTIGKKVTAHFSQDNEVIIASRNSGDEQVDIAQIDSIKALFKRVGKLDAIINICGDAKWAPFNDLSEADYQIGLQSKLMGQVNMVRIGQDYLNPKGSITLTTGILADHPVKMTASAAMVNGGIHSFVKAVSLELDKETRVNAVSLGLVEDAYERYKDYFIGHQPITMKDAVGAYISSVDSDKNGEIIRVY